MLNNVDQNAAPTSLLERPFVLAGRTLRNRVMHPSIVTFLPNAGEVTNRLVQYHENRARGGAGLIVTEPLSMARYQDVPNWVRVWTDRAEEGLKRWADAVERHDTRLLAQLVDRGRGRNVPGRNPNAIAPSALPDDLSLTMPRALQSQEIEAMVEEFTSSALRLQRCGFSGIEISAGHGHLFHQFLSPRMNRREDEYGGSLQGRTKFLRDLVSSVRSACGAGFIIAVKLPADDWQPGSIDLEEAHRIARLVTASQQVDLVSFANGSHSHTLERHVPDDFEPRVPYLHQLRHLRDAVGSVPMAALGRITDPAEAEGILARGEAELIALGRALIADPAWPTKAAQGRAHAIRYCVSCNTCWERTTAQRSPIACDNNPHVAEPDEVFFTPARSEQSVRVAVVGAGVAGLEAAWTAAARGHQVTLYGASPRVGGKALLRAGLPGGESLSSVYDYQESMARQWGVAFKLGARVRAADLLESRLDRVVLACGATMSVPLWIPSELVETGIVGDVRTVARDLERVTAHQQGAAVIYDMDQTEGTYALAVRLAELFDRVMIVTPHEFVARDTSVVRRQGILRRLSIASIECLTLSHLVCGPDFDGTFIDAVHIHTGRAIRIDDVALLSYSTPRIPNDELAAPLLQAGIRVQIIGDCRNARDVLAATSEGYAAGMEV